MNSQDTIALLNNEKVACTLLEIGLSEIRYKKWQDLTESVQIVAKNQVYYLRYSNGIREFMPGHFVEPANKLRLSAENYHFYLGNVRISEVECFALINKIADPEKRKKLTDLKIELRRIIKSQHRCFAFGLPLLLSSVYTFLIIQEFDSNATALGVAGIQASCGVIMVAQSAELKQRRKITMKQIAFLYNQ